MEAHTERMERFEEAIYKQREEINKGMKEMLSLLKELTKGKSSKKALVRKEVSKHVIKYVNAISLIRIKSDKDKGSDKIVDKNIIKPIELVDIEETMDDEKDNESDGSKNKDSTRWGKYVDRRMEMPRSQPIGYYLKQKNNKKMIKGVVQPVAPTTTEQRLARQNELKARGTLLMDLPDKHQLTFNIHKDAKTLMETIEKRLQKLISQLQILRESLSQEDINLNLKIYEAEVKSSSSTSTSTQNIAFVSPSNTDSTNKPIGAAASVSAIDADDLEEMDLKWKGHFARECRSPKDTRRNGAAEPQRRNVLAEEESTNYALMAFTSLSSFSSDNETLNTYHRGFNPQDWVSDLEDDSEAEIPQNAPSFIQPNEQVKTLSSSVKPVETSIPAANSKTAIPKPNSKGNNKNRKACFVPVTTIAPMPHVTRLRQAKTVVTKPHSPPRRHINCSPSLKASNFHLKVTAAKAPMVNVVKDVQGKWEWKPKCPILDHGNPRHALKDKGVIDSGCSRHMIGNMSYFSDFEAINGGYVAFGGNPKGGKISGKGIENQLSLKVKIIRSDNGTEFKYNDLNHFCGMKGIKREFSVPKTPQQNGITERKNRTLIEAARTMLADLLLPIPFWAEAVNNACYVHNRVLVTKP
nr:putative ribonuclease H-like domain-containing protein [Tanacetum cinerariifolium]